MDFRSYSVPCHYTCSVIIEILVQSPRTCLERLSYSFLTPPVIYFKFLGLKTQKENECFVDVFTPILGVN